MSTLIGLKLNDTVVLATDSLTYTYDKPKHIISDCQQKVFEIAPGVFYAWSGRTSVAIEQVRIARMLARTAQPINLRTFAAALNAASLSELRVEANRLLVEQFQPAISGELPFQVYILAGMSEGVPGFLVCEFRLKNNEIHWEFSSTFKSNSNGLKTYITGDRSTLEDLYIDPITWADGIIAAGERFVDQLRRVTPDCVGGLTQMACIEKSGARWVHQPVWMESVSVVQREPDGLGGVAAKIGSMLAFDGSGATTVAIAPAGPLYADISGKLNLQIASDFVVSGGVLTQNIVNLAKAVNFNTTNFAISGGSLVISAVAVNQLIAGTALFANTATFAYTSTGPAIQVGSSGAVFMDNYSSPTCTLTVNSSGFSVVRGSNILEVTPSGVSIFGPSGSLTASSGGIIITNGSSSVTVAPGGVTIVNGNMSVSGPGGVTINIDATHGLKATNGSYYTDLNSGYVDCQYTGGAVGGAFASLTPFVFQMQGGRSGGNQAGVNSLVTNTAVTWDYTDGNAILQVSITTGTASQPGVQLWNGANLTIHSGCRANFTDTAGSAPGGSATLPAPVGFLPIQVGGATHYLAYF